jgi:hypothetical protein
LEAKNVPSRLDPNKLPARALFCGTLVNLGYAGAGNEAVEVVEISTLCIDNLANLMFAERCLILATFRLRLFSAGDLRSMPTEQQGKFEALLERLQ